MEIIEENNLKYHSNRKPRSVFGVILVLAGVLFLLSNFGWIHNEWKHILISWQMLLIFIGIAYLFRRQPIHGILLISIGGFFILPHLAKAYPDTLYLESDFTQTYWPVLLIIAGVLILLRVYFYPHHHIPHTDIGSRKYHHRHHKFQKFGSERNSIFGSVEEIILDPVFSGCELNAVFGGIELDLRKTSLPVGDTIIVLNAVFGGVTVYIPNNWCVELHLDNVFGGFQDRRDVANEADIDHSKKLIINATCVFGGGEIKN